MLQEMEHTHPECPEAILAHARIADRKGATAEAEDAFVRYANLRSGPWGVLTPITRVFCWNTANISGG